MIMFEGETKCQQIFSLFYCKIYTVIVKKLELILYRKVFRVHIDET